MYVTVIMITQNIHIVKFWCIQEQKYEIFIIFFKYSYVKNKNILDKKGILCV